MVEVEGKISKKSISILIDLGYTHGYITPRVVEICSFKKLKNENFDQQKKDFKPSHL